MYPDELFEAWKQRRMSSELPPDFTDRVMSRVAAHEARYRQRAVARLLFVLTASRIGRAGFVTLALLLFAMRLLSVLALFLNLPGVVE